MKTRPYTPVPPVPCTLLPATAASPLLLLLAALPFPTLVGVTYSTPMHRTIKSASGPMQGWRGSEEQREERPAAGGVRLEVLAVPAVRHAGRQRQVGHLCSVGMAAGAGGQGSGSANDIGVHARAPIQAPTNWPTGSLGRQPSQGSLGRQPSQRCLRASKRCPQAREAQQPLPAPTPSSPPRAA